MGNNGVSDVSAGTGEGVGRMLNGTGLTLGSIARSGASRDGRSLGLEACIDNVLAEVGGFWKVTEGVW